MNLFSNARSKLTPISYAPNVFSTVFSYPIQAPVPYAATHLRNFLRWRWWASKPSDRVFKSAGCTSLRGPGPPNQRTQTRPGVGAGPTNLPGHEGCPRAAPHTRSPAPGPPEHTDDPSLSSTQHHTPSLHSTSASTTHSWLAWFLYFQLQNYGVLRVYHKLF